MAACDWPDCDVVLNARNRTGRCRQHPIRVPLPEPTLPVDIGEPPAVLDWLLRIHVAELAAAVDRGPISPQRLDYARRGILAILSHPQHATDSADGILDEIATRLRDIAGIEL